MVTDELTLWKVQIPNDELPELDSDFDYKTEGAMVNTKKLSPLDEIQDAFPVAPHRKHVHIIVELPPVDEPLRRAHCGSDM